jgi:hypothetical protein
MTLEAFIDDSGNDPNSHAFILAGFVAPSQNWNAFSIEWKNALDRAPGASYFKAAEAYSLNNQFHKRKGWTRELRDNLVTDLTTIVRKHVTAKFAVWVRRADFDKHLKTLSLPYARDAADNPYFLCFYYIILTIAALHSLGKPEPCDFIFDEQSKVGRTAVSWWGMFKHNAATASRTDFTPYLGSLPVFKNEKQFLPLQAADLYAWHMNR